MTISGRSARVTVTSGPVVMYTVQFLDINHLFSCCLTTLFVHLGYTKSDELGG
jgi:hypothetical protein